MQLEDQGELDLFFADESGFKLTPSIPYGWQPVGEQVSIRSAKDHVTNVFGMLSRNGKLITYLTPHYIDSDFVIECLNEVAQRIERLTVLVIDNAPWHTSKKIDAHIQAWQDKGLFLFRLPTYSPHLNLIEILWRKMKYEWLKAEHYLSANALYEAICNMIKNYDHEFSIEFSKNLFK